MPSSRPSPTSRREKELWAVGVDNGGTWIRLKGFNARGQCLWSVNKPSPPLEKLPSFLSKQLKPFKGKLVTLAVGSRGIWTQAQRRAVKNALRGLAGTVHVLSDVEAAWLAAFGPRSAGIIVISGTGSIAYGRSLQGQSARAGGLGPANGDEGSGYWIGTQWLRRSHPLSQRERARPTKGRAAGEGNQAVRRTASLASSIVRKAKSGNPLAAEITREAQSHLADLVVELTHRLSMKGSVPLAVAGSVLQNHWFRQGFFKILKKNRVHFKFVKAKKDPTTAIVPSARRERLRKAKATAHRLVC